MLKINCDVQLALPPHESPSTTSGERKIKDFYTAKELYDLNVKTLPMLVENIILQTGLMILCGSSDVGKSTFSRQLALSIAGSKEEFLGWKLHARHNKVIYVSTEDDSVAISYLLNKTIIKEYDKNYLNNIRYVFDSSFLLKKLDAMLKEQPADCIIIDSFGDIFDGELNQLNKVRGFMEKYFKIVGKYNTLIIFIHHTRKRTENLPPNKNNLIGSQGIEGRARQVIELRKDPGNSQYRHLCIVKGNYIPDSEKESSYKLKFNDSLFERTNDRVDFSSLTSKPNGKKDDESELIQKIVKMKDVEKMTFEKIAEKLTSEGEKICKSTVHKLYSEYKKSSAA